MATENQKQWVERKVREGTDEILATDVRTGLTGGVRCVGGRLEGHYISGMSNHGLQIVFIVNSLPISDYGYVVSGATGFLGHFGIAVFPDGSCQIYNGSNGISLGAWPAGSIVPGAVNFLNWNHIFNVSHTGNLNGIDSPIDYDIAGWEYPLVWIGCQAYGGVDKKLNCDVILWRVTNFAMNADEQLGASRGEAVGRLAKRGYVVDTSTIGDGGGLPAFTTRTSSGGTVSLTLNAGALYASALFYGLTTSFKKGDIVRVRGNVTTFSSPTGVTIWNEGVGNQGTNLHDINGLGAFDATVTITLDSLTPLGIRTYPFGAGSISVTIENFEAIVIGTVANYAAGNVTASSRWLDDSGNGYDLISVGNGVIALDPQPIQVRNTVGSYRLATPAVISGPSYVTQARITDPGVLRLTFPTWMQNQLQVKGRAGVYFGVPTLIWGNTTLAFGNIDLGAWRVDGSPGLINEDIVWESSHLE